MADVTISALTPGIPTGGSIIPYSTGSNTLNILRIAENDIISFSIEGATITAIDSNLWSYYNFMFWSN